jgi:hypothetical protein
MPFYFPNDLLMLKGDNYLCKYASFYYIIVGYSPLLFCMAVLKICVNLHESEDIGWSLLRI